VEGRDQLKVLRDSWEDNITMDLTEVGCGGLEQIHVV
jgi:hypothetical protein